MSDGRRDPDELLRVVTEEERLARRGKLTVFFGAAPGVGKTYSMLEAARAEHDAGRDVVIGVVETHGRYDTGALVIGLEMLPRRKETHRGVELGELDLDGALARKPALLLVDELAHTNAPGSLHAKRWQDVEEVLDAGIDVYTTLNVQHVESLNDVVAQVTGVVVRETVPDRVLEEASEVRLIDLPPDELLERLGAGKVYLPAQAQRAVDNFFRKGNLIALRELALRRTAERVDAQMRVYKSTHGIEGTWATGDRILVCVSPSPLSAQLVRGACRMARSLHAEWIAVYVETPAALRLNDAGRRRVADNLRLAEQLGAETATLSGESAAQETLRYARKRNVTRIVVGKPTHSRWRDLVSQPFLEEMVRGSGDIDVHVITGEAAAGEGARAAPPAERRRGSPAAYASSVAIVAATGGVAWFVFGRGRLDDVVMVFLLAIILIAMRFGSGPSLLATVLSVLAVDFFFVTPYYSLSVDEFRHVVTFGVMFVVAVLISGLTKRIRDQADAARRREQRTSSLYGMTRDLAGTRAVGNLAAIAVEHLHDVFDARAAVLLLDAAGDLTLVTAGGPHAFVPDAKERTAAEWARAHGKPAGLGTDTLPSGSALYLPLPDSRGRGGVLAVVPADPRRFVDPAQRALLDVFAAQVASALERARLAEEAQRAQLEMESEKLRSSLLSSVSHDLRTPLTVISAAASALLESNPAVGAEARQDLLQTVHEEAQRLNRLVRNLLDMTRVASGAIKVSKEWQPVEEVVGAVLNRLEEPLAGREVVVDLAPDLPLVPMDAVLVEQVLINLLENAAKYSPPASPLRIAARAEDGAIVVEVADRGPGVPPEQARRIFEKFYRMPGERVGGGAGLGLAICRGVVEAHGGRIWVDHRDGGGAVFRFTIPIEGTPPVIQAEEAR